MDALIAYKFIRTYNVTDETNKSAGWAMGSTKYQHRVYADLNKLNVKLFNTIRFKNSTKYKKVKTTVVI